MTDTEHAVMGMAARWWRVPGHLEEAVRAELGMSPTRYFQVLAQLIERHDVEATYPQLVHRLRRQTRPARGRELTMRLDG